MEKEEAFIGVLACAVAADSLFENAELDLLELLVKYHRFTKDLAENSHSAMVERVKKNVAKNGTMTAVLDYANIIPIEWRGATYLSALDLLFVDGNSNIAESDFVQFLGSSFEIPTETTQRFVAIFREKHGVF